MSGVSGGVEEGKRRVLGAMIQSLSVIHGVATWADMAESLSDFSGMGK